MAIVPIRFPTDYRASQGRRREITQWLWEQKIPYTIGNNTETDQHGYIIHYYIFEESKVLLFKLTWGGS